MQNYAQVIASDEYAAYAIAALGLIGAYTVGKATLSVLGSFSRHYLRGTHNMFTRYGK